MTRARRRATYDDVIAEPELHLGEDASPAAAIVTWG
jgi:hypothetical protein